ncbi:conjugal transfer protein TrbL family protein [Neobacillus pocheonensis]|uniref:conjugal transfer protein TrbL family protein n=1 Tax=Neobacillus pocheonensis TaxID=363869 RepID=UPI003D26CDBF
MNFAIQLVFMAFMYLVEQIAQQALDMMLILLPKISEVALKILDLPIVSSVILCMQGTALTILAVKVSYEAIISYILRINGDPDADPGGLLIKTVHATAVIMSVPWIVKTMYKFGVALAADIAGLDEKKLNGDPNSVTNDNASLMIAFMTRLLARNNIKLFVCIAILLAVVILVVVVVQTSIRAGELATLAAGGSLTALSLTGSGQYYEVWWKELAMISLTQALQIFLLKVAFYLLFKIDFGEQFVNLFLFVGVLWCTFKSPQWLRQFVHSTGVGRTAGGAAQQAGSMIMMRKMLTKGAA